MAGGHEKHECGAEPGGNWPRPTRLHDCLVCVFAILYSAAYVFGLLHSLFSVAAVVVGG